MKNQETSIAVIGLGYVGLPLAVAFAKKYPVIGFDLNKEKVDKYRKGKDVTNEVGDDEIKNTTLLFSTDENELDKANFFIVAVPTPISSSKAPDLNPIISASCLVGRHLSKGAIVVFESTVYPGVTEEVCVPLLEKESGLRIRTDFYVGYSPERINPGDKIHRLNNIKKIVSGIDKYSLNYISEVYASIIDAGVYQVSSIKVAEAAKVCENSQRDINIAFVNELAMVFDRMEINTNEVIDAMNTKWNALGFRPGLVGGHCIGVDPYYLIYDAEKYGYNSQIIAAGRRVNEQVTEHIVSNIIKKMIVAGINVNKARIGFFGITFKENCPDTRNSKAIEIVKKLKEYGVEIYVNDAYAEGVAVKKEEGITLVELDEITDCDCVVIAVSHDRYIDFSLEQILNLYKRGSKNSKVFIDVKGCFSSFKDQLDYWSL